MEILWWLAPSGAVTLAAMVWVAWLGREGRGEVDREVAVRRLARALSKESPRPRLPEARVRERNTGIAVRPARAPDGPGVTTRKVS